MIEGAALPFWRRLYNWLSLSLFYSALLIYPLLPTPKVAVYEMRKRQQSFLCLLSKLGMLLLSVPISVLSLVCH